MLNTANKRNEVVVIGCGVIGLTSALRLQECGAAVKILAKELPPNTTSDRAAAIWEPYRAEPQERVREWSKYSYEEYQMETKNRASGVEMVELTIHGKKPFWLDDYDHETLEPSQMPKGCNLGGYCVPVPFINSAIYLKYLMQLFIDSGGRIESRKLASLKELGGSFDVIVNCSGLGARELVLDNAVFSIRGQLAVVERSSSDLYLVDDTSFDGAPVYIFPRGEESILGGTVEDHNEDLTEDIGTRNRIIDRCVSLDPSLQGRAFKHAIVGLRPGRSEVRLDCDEVRGGPRVIHNYGHGGSGFTVAWGCARDVLRLFQSNIGAGSS